MTHYWMQFALLSDAAQMAIVGGLFWLAAAICGLLERRRGSSRDVARLERVGFMPWTTMFVLFAIIGGGLLAMSLPVVIGSL